MSLFPELQQETKSSSSLFPEVKEYLTKAAIQSSGIPGVNLSAQVEPTPENLKSFSRPLLEQGGYLAGELGGTTLAPGPGTIAGAAVGQGAGRVAADAIEAYADKKPLPNKMEMAKSFGTGAAIGGGSALAGLGVAKVLKAGSKVKEALSGVDSARFDQLVKNPSNILPESLGGPKSIREAGKLLEEAEAKAGVPEQTVGELALFKRTGLNKAGLKELDVLEKAIKEGVPLDDMSNKALLDNIGRVDKIIKTESATEFSELGTRAKMLRKHLISALAKNEPDLQAARSVYHDAAVRREFTAPAGGLLPKNKGGTVSRLARYALPGVLGGALGLARGNKAEGVGFGLGVGAAESPLVLGGLTALGAAGGGGLGLPISLGLSAYNRAKNK